MNYLGDFAEDSTVRIALTTNNGDGGVVAPSSAFEAADFVIYKNGSATQKATTNGITCTSPFDSVVGLHVLEIDTSNDTGDSGFWATAADYWVVAIPDETVDSQTVVQVVATFSIENRYMRGTDGANTTTPPTAAANATAVRSELTTELGRIDVATSTRLAGASYSAAPSAATVADAVWDEATVDHTSTGSFGAGVGYIITTVAAILVGVNQLTARITSTLFSGITRLSHWLGAIAGKTADIATRTEINATTGGATYNETTDSLEAIRDRGDTAWVSGQGTSIMVTPVVAQVPVRVRDTDIETYIGDLSTIRIGIFSGEDAVDLSGFGDLEVCVQAKDGTDLDFIEMADLTIDGTDNNYVSWDPSGPSVATIRRGKWSLRKSSNKQVVAKGSWIISDAALEDTGS